MIYDDYDGQGYPEMVWSLSFPHTCLTVEEKAQKKPQPGKLTRPGIETAHAGSETTMLFLDHSGDLANVKIVIMYCAFSQELFIVIIRVFCPRAGLPPQT